MQSANDVNSTASIVELADNQDANKDKFLSFRVGTEWFGIELLKIKEILEFEGIRSIPMVPKELKGLINLRGNVFPVIDVAQRLGMPFNEPNERSCIMVVEVVSDRACQKFGLLVDQIAKVHVFHPSDIVAPPSFGINIDTSLLLGMGRLQDEFIKLVCIDMFLDIQYLADQIREFSERQFTRLLANDA